MENGKPKEKKRVFVLGDSRTGTTSLHQYFLKLGYASIHYYPDEAQQKSPDHLNHTENWENLKTFIDKGKYQCFSDYPTRSFYRELMDYYPDAYFILSVRKDVGTWATSMRSYFQNRTDVNVNDLIPVYTIINEAIRSYSNETRVQFLEMCIDDPGDSYLNTLRRFLDAEQQVKMPHVNASIKSRNLLFPSDVNFDSISCHTLLERMKNRGKAMISESGWIHLINDSFDYLPYQFGVRKWTELEEKHAILVFSERHRIVSELGTEYKAYISPEKSAVYPESLPAAFDQFTETDKRPALVFRNAGLDFLHYPLSYLIRHKPIGQLYFKGDTHANWLGSYVLYRYIMEDVIELPFMKKFEETLVTLEKMIPEIASYDGDLLPHVTEDQRKLFRQRPQLQFPGGFENTIAYRLSPGECKTKRVEVPEVYQQCFDNRETLIFEHENENLPKVVVFRDSTSQFLCEWIAQSFSRSVFVWHYGHIIPEVIEREKPDLVLQILGERVLSNVFEHPVLLRMPVIMGRENPIDPETAIA